ncbi:DUF1491 domain-containing protein [Phyllobacterium phragmitis]|uniref:DUF1491 domain-containing protein n=1 Tax=Phyllobacterium phragmitis TaxID=2670329 RepID=A0A2S9IZ32_9HYPH|nr:DUF1491 family protein [Phyllobacterium phragmitis]PRD45789.1 DUF1491 domain-containing protein [Phyllobacterium phragmitis]
MRLTSDFWVSALMRRVSGDGGFATLARRGSSDAGAIFIKMRQADGRYDLYGPAPQTAYDSGKPDERVFTRVGQDLAEWDADEKLRKEARFDPDLWLVEIEGYAGDEPLFPISEV